MTDVSELPPLEALEPFGWIFTPGPLPSGSISASEAVLAAGMHPDQSVPRDIAVLSGAYTEKGRYRQEADGRRVTLYLEHPVWAVTSGPDSSMSPAGNSRSAQRYSRHTLVDGRRGRPITQFLLLHEPGSLRALDLHEPLDTPEMSLDEAITAAISGEERVLTDLPRTAEYGARWRLIPGFIQVTDVWRVTFDTSSLPPMSPAAKPDVAWVVIVDDKARHRWLSAALQETPVPNDSTTSPK
jgi:hypothetical protein